MSAASCYMCFLLLICRILPVLRKDHSRRHYMQAILLYASPLPIKKKSCYS